MFFEKIARCGLTILLIFSLSTTKAQISYLSATPKQLNFQPLFDGQPDSLGITIKNNSGWSYYLQTSIPFSEFGSTPFSIRDTGFVLEPMQIRQIWVYARISHNVVNRGALLVRGSVAGNSSNPTFVNPINLSIPISCQGKFRKTYYNTTQNLSEEALKQALKSRLDQNYNSLGYNSARDEMYGSLDNKNDSVTCIYTNRKAKFNTRNGASSNNFNCEHTFPQGFFGSDEPMRSDIHHLYSTDENANNSRGNLPFGMAVPPLIQTAINFPSKNGGGKYEPQDSHKGRCARSMMYFVLRYQDYTNFYKPQDTVLRRWHRQFPVQAWDTLRNNGIFQLQNNRNPFVDYPQFENRISNLTSASVSDSTPKLFVSNPGIQVSDYTNPTDSVIGFLIWNTGNKALKISRLRPDNGPTSNNMLHLLNPADSAFSVSRNSSKVVWMHFSASGSDTLRFQSNDPQKPFVKIPVGLVVVSNNPAQQPLKVRVFPNPAQKTVNFSGLQADEEFEVRLQDILGRPVFQTVLPGSSQQVILPDCPAGMYRISVRQGSFTHTEKLIINP